MNEDGSSGSARMARCLAKVPFPFDAGNIFMRVEVNDDGEGWALVVAADGLAK